jgi:hypothetical protein
MRLNVELGSRREYPNAQRIVVDRQQRRRRRGLKEVPIHKIDVTMGLLYRNKRKENESWREWSE